MPSKELINELWTSSLYIVAFNSVTLKLTGQTSVVFLSFKIMYCLKKDFLKQEVVEMNVPMKTIS